MTPIYRKYKHCRTFHAQNAPVAEGLQPTSSDIEGPFYKPNAPFQKHLVELKDVTLTLTGMVRDTDGNPIDALLDFWQADANGVYVGYEKEENWTMRGRQTTATGEIDPEGHYELKTIHPGCYQIDDHEFRCSHIHVKVTAPGFKPLTTQLYFSGDKYDETDHWFSKDRVICSVNDSQATFDFVLERE